MYGSEVNIYNNHLTFTQDYFDYSALLDFEYAPAEYYHQMGLSFSLWKGDTWLRLKDQSGLAAFWGRKRTELSYDSPLFGTDYYNEENFLTRGLELKLGVSIVPSNYISIGADLQSIINLERTFYMPMVNIERGKLR